MAASITKTLPRTINLISNCMYGTSRIACCCRLSSLLKCHESQVTSYSQNQGRHIFTYSPLRQRDRNSPKASDTVEDTDEPDVLYKKIIIEVKGHDERVLRSYQIFVTLACKHLAIPIFQVTKPRVQYERHSVAKSVHIYKKHYSQYEHRTHFLVFEIHKLTGSTADTLLEYIQRNLPEGTAMKVTRHRLEKFPENLVPPTEDQEQLEAS
ncbi:small ribosomal subunit protein uS10m-like [Ruditapes philippinarum]|uniref:small ribosomal subunit protein uS10m-like n=1 Tax=Ruditapes philippinarum TaxID=129788 RepID=UPI00295C257A|nr:small ribosomal subunit protein uS10m-like [Ruditapes philippinarum]